MGIFDRFRPRDDEGTPPSPPGGGHSGAPVPPRREAPPVHRFRAMGADADGVFDVKVLPVVTAPVEPEVFAYVSTAGVAGSDTDRGLPRASSLLAAGTVHRLLFARRQGGPLLVVPTPVDPGPFPVELPPKSGFVLLAVDATSGRAVARQVELVAEETTGPLTGPPCLLIEARTSTKVGAVAVDFDGVLLDLLDDGNRRITGCRVPAWIPWVAAAAEPGWALVVTAAGEATVPVVYHAPVDFDRTGP